MLDISNIRIPVDQLDGTERTEELALRKAVLRKLHVTPDDLLSVEPRKRSIDARKKNDVHFTYSVRVILRGRANAERDLMAKLKRRHGDGSVRIAEPKPFSLPGYLGTERVGRPVVVGAGCAGLFGAALPGTLQSIGDGAFSDCEELGDVTLPESVEQIEGNPFAGCPRLTALPMPADHPHFFMKDGALTSSADGHIICALPVQSEGGTP